MVEWLGRRNQIDDFKTIGKMIDQSVAEHLKQGKLLTYDLGGNAGCSHVGESIASILATKLSEV